jgi:hypothetical protein
VLFRRQQREIILIRLALRIPAASRTDIDVFSLPAFMPGAGQVGCPFRGVHLFSSSLNPPPMAENPERFYRSGEKCDQSTKYEFRNSKKIRNSNERNKTKKLPKAFLNCRLFCMLDIAQLLFKILIFDHSNLPFDLTQGGERVEPLRKVLRFQPI